MVLSTHKGTALLCFNILPHLPPILLVSYTLYFFFLPHPFIYRRLCSHRGCIACDSSCCWLSARSMASTCLIEGSSDICTAELAAEDAYTCVSVLDTAGALLLLKGPQPAGSISANDGNSPSPSASARDSELVKVTATTAPRARTPRRVNREPPCPCVASGGGSAEAASTYV